METKVNIISAHENELEVKLNYDEISSELEKAYLEERKTIQLPGFRKGKVPLPVLKRLYGEAIEYKASEKISNNKFWEIVEQLKLKPISTPALSDLNFEMGKKLDFKVRYEVIPAIEVKDYTGLEIEIPVFKVNEEEIQHEYQHLLKSHAKFEETDTVSSKDCKITVDLRNLNDDKDSGGKGLAIDLSDEKVNPQIPERALGKKTGETFEFSFSNEVPQQDGTSNKIDLNYSANITKIEKLILPEENEEFFNHVSYNKAKTKDELLANLRENFVNYFKSQTDNIYLNSLLNKVVENNPFEVPKGYVETLHHRMLHEEEETAKRQKKYFDKKSVSEQLRPRAEWSAKWQIVMENIASKEEIKVGESDLEELVKKESASTGISEEKLMKYYKDSGRDEIMLEDKVIEFLKSKNPPLEYDPKERAEKNKSEKISKEKTSAEKKETSKGTKKSETSVKKKSSDKENKD